MFQKNILITGPPRTGKTTLIIKLSESLKEFHPVGFYTLEIKEKGIRKGFKLISPDGREGLLSHVDIKSPYRVGKYRVDIRGFEDFLDSISFLASGNPLVIVDEIGRMELFSERFRRLIMEILGSQKLLIATIALKGNELIAEIKKRKDVKLFEITRGNRESLFSEVLKKVRELLPYEGINTEGLRGKCRSQQ